MTKDVSLLISDLNAADASQRAEAAETLAQMDESARAAAVPLVRVAGDEDEIVSEWAVAALENIGPPSPDDVEALAELLGDENAEIGYWSATLLGRLGEAAVGAVGALAEALAETNDIPVRQRAAWALGKMGGTAAPAADALKKVAQDGDARLARLAQQALDNLTH